jgi:S1-C subfamily serine protease
MVSSQEASSVLLDLSNNLADAVERAGRSVVSVEARHRVPSSGVIWRQGIVVTADHTIEREEGITVGLPDGSKVQATLAGRDSGTDLAVLRIDGANLPAAERSEEALRVGHIAVAVGRPGEAGLSASWGAISSVGGPWRTWAGGQIDAFVRPDLTFYPGFSGGPLIDAAGRVAGINTSGLSRSLGLTIPAGTVERVVDALLSKGRIARGYLGLGLQGVRLPDSLVQSLGLQGNSGLIVVSVESNGPGDKAGIFVGDVLVALDGTPVSDTDTIQARLGPDSVGKAVPVTIVRGGQRTEVTLTVGERPSRGA